MPSHNRKPDTAARQSPKARAADLRSRTARVTPDAPAASSNPPVSLANCILAHWREHDAAPDEGPTYEASYERRWQLLDAADALPATQESIFAKSLALAWISHVNLWKRGVPREHYAMDGRLALDIHQAAVSAAASLAGKGAGDNEYVGLPDPLKIAAALPVAGLSMRDLWLLHDVFGTFQEIGQALLCQPRCKAETHGADIRRSPAGAFVEWLTDAMMTLADEVLHEAEGRRPDGEDEAECRLRILADAWITNGDASEMRSLAADLETQASRIEARRSARG